MTDDLLARIEAALDPLCPRCGHQTTDAALTLYGHCFDHGMAVEYAPTTWLPDPLHQAATAIAEQIVDEHQRATPRPPIRCQFTYQPHPAGEVLRCTRPSRHDGRCAAAGRWWSNIDGIACICGTEPGTNASIPNEDGPQHGVMSVDHIIEEQSGLPSLLTASFDSASIAARARNRAALEAGLLTAAFQRPAEPPPCDCPDTAVGFDGAWESGVAVHCRVHGYRLLPYEAEPDSPPKPLSTWQIITRWCQRRLARRRHRR